MSKRIIPVILVLTISSIFIALRSQGNSDGTDDPPSYYSQVLRNVGILLEQGHYQPKKINDQFGKEVFTEFINDIDPDHKILLASDVTELEKYSGNIDDEIHGKDVKSFLAIHNLYTQRQAEIRAFYKDLLQKNFDFNVKESIQLGEQKQPFPKNDAERKDTWRKFLKYLVLDKFVSLQTAREAEKGKAGVKYKDDITLQNEARAAVIKQMERYFTTTVNRETSDYNFGKFVNNITTVMDPHSNYFPPVDLRTFNEGMSGTFYGIGALLKEEDGQIKIGSIITGMPAWTSKQIKEGDVVLKVGQGNDLPVDVTGYSVEDAVKLIRGEKETIVKLTLRTIEGEEKVVAIKRGKINQEETFAQSVIIDSKNKIGYIYLPEFYANFEDQNAPRSADDVAKEIKKLKAEGVSAIVLDLRGNGGGSLYDVVQMVGFFIDRGPVVQVKAREGNPRILDDKTSGTLWDGPLAVMVDETSASASEIFAAAIQDYKRGVVIGSTSTYGKGTVQQNIPLNPNNNSFLSNKNEKEKDLGTVKLTLQKFYRINGDATQQKGVIPDIVLPDRLEFLKIREKDNPFSLKYDEIKPTEYRIWDNLYNTSSLVSKVNMYADTNNTFTKIKMEAKKLEKNIDKNFPLNIGDYKTDLKEKKESIARLEKLYKLNTELKVTNLQSNLEFVNKTKENTDRNKQFIKRVAGDIYIDETVKVLDDIITGEKVARAN